MSEGKDAASRLRDWPSLHPNYSARRTAKGPACFFLVPIMSQSTNTPLGLSRMLMVRDIAKVLGVSAPTVRRLCAKGELPKPLKIGRAVRWPVAVVEAWLAEKCAGVATQHQEG
jgi:excisionase family DNA binding protein